LLFLFRVSLLGKSEALPELPDLPLQYFLLIGRDVDVVVLNNADEALVFDL
jgi:hypothetical protein